VTVIFAQNRIPRTVGMLVLLAVFCFSALQATEGLHQHPLGDATDLCLVCKADSGSAVTDIQVAAAQVAARATITTPALPSGNRFAQLTPPVRGPPSNS
jgi:hypothetical protein